MTDSSVIGSPVTGSGNAPQPATLRQAWAIAWPASLAAIVTPLLGLIDTAVLARGADTEALAGAALAGAVFSVLYWTFGFLRMSLSGLAAQALGAGDRVRLRGHLVQGLAIGLAVGLCLLALSHPLGVMAQRVLVESTEASAEAGEAMRRYIAVRILAAPAALPTMALVGWLTGQGRTGLMMVVTIGMAASNAVLSMLFVLGLDWGITGLAAATALAETLGLALGALAVVVVLRPHGGWQAPWHVRRSLKSIGGVLNLNRDIFVRSAVLTLVIASFSRLSATFGDLTVAANHVLLNLVLTVTLLLDGTAIAAETLVGQALGASSARARLFEAAWKTTSILAAVLAVALTAGVALFGRSLIDLIVGDTPGQAQLIAEAIRFLPWAALAPLALVVAFQLDGVYIGATRGAALRNTMAAAGLVYIAANLVLMPSFGNHGLWAAFLLFMLARGLGLVIAWPGFRPRLAAERHA